MAARATGSGTISFGLVSIPVKFYTATSSHRLAFHMLHRRCGTRVHMQYYCPVDEEVVSRSDLVRGFEHAKDQFVTLTDEDLAALEGERSDRIDIVEFVPESSVDLTYLADTHYLGPGKGGDRAYLLLLEAMSRTGRVAVGRFGARGREQLVMLRPHDGVLVMHRLYYADEVRSPDEVDFPRQVPFREAEMHLAQRLVEQLSTDGFDPTRHPDEYRDRVLAAVEQKVAGQEITVAPEAPPAQIVDLFEALRRSLAERPAAAPAERRGRAAPAAPAAKPAAKESRAAEASRRPGLRKTAATRRRAGARTGTGG